MSYIGKHGSGIKKNIFVHLGGDIRFAYSASHAYPILTDLDEEAGHVDRHYFFQDIFVAQRVRKNGHAHIYDIGSRLDGYIAHLLSMGIRVSMIDIRPLKLEVKGLSFVQADAMALAGIPDESLEALSCLHALEHFGLGRYGDPIDYFGWEKALHAMERKLISGGWLYLSVPCGKEEMVMFNAQRIFHPMTLYRELCSSCVLVDFSAIHNYTIKTWDFINATDIEEKLIEIPEKFLGEYDCGIFVFQKR